MKNLIKKIAKNFETSENMIKGLIAIGAEFIILIAINI